MKDVDPLEEVYRIREEFARRHNYDIHAMILALREQSKAAGRKTVSFPPRRPVGWSHAAKKNAA